MRQRGIARGAHGDRRGSVATIEQVRPFNSQLRQAATRQPGGAMATAGAYAGATATGGAIATGGQGSGGQGTGGSIGGAGGTAKAKRVRFRQPITRACNHRENISVDGGAETRLA